MQSLDILKEEFENVKRALKETLRHDYVPERSQEYYDECGLRLTEIRRQISAIDPTSPERIAAAFSDLSASPTPITGSATPARIAGLLSELRRVANWVSLIERSHLGEFSWPFAERLRSYAKTLLAEKDMADEKLEPIVHVVSEGSEYQIVYEKKVPPTSGKHRFFVVAFPRPLKHHVLLHSIFGHELAHTAIHATPTGMQGAGVAGDVLNNAVIQALTSQGPMQNAGTLDAWIRDANAPISVRNGLALEDANWAPNRYQIHDFYRKKWLVELICDLFGLLLFGPGFMGAHRALLEPTHPDAYGIHFAEPTHPPYAVRHRMLVRVMRLLKWDNTVSAGPNAPAHKAERDFLDYTLADSYIAWASLFTDQQLTTAVQAIRTLFKAHGTGYEPARSDLLERLVLNVVRGVPPVLVDITNQGDPKLHAVDISQVLYAGWIYWIGRKRFSNAVPTNFFDTNRLCDLALLQQCAIDISISPGESECRSWAAKQ